MSTLTLLSVQTMVQDKELISMAQSVFKAMACVETIREVIEPLQQQVIDKHQFKTSKMWDEVEGSRTITKESDMFLASDEDFQIYVDEMNKLHVSHGFVKSSPDHCPLLVAENLLVQANRVFVDSTSKYTGIDADMLLCSRDGMKRYTEYIDLNLNLFAPIIKAQKD